MNNKLSAEEQKRQEELEEEEQKKADRRDDFYPGSYKNNRKKGNYKIYIFTQEDLDNDDIISMVETTPTYKRSKAVLESIQSRAVAEESSTPKLDNSENGSMTITF